MDGKMLAACTENGTLLWQKGIRGNPEAFFSVLPDDFICIVTDRSRITVLNPNGLVLWTASVPFGIVSKPFAGRDGRFFVRGQNGIACYGMNGVCKWKVDTENQAGLLPQTLNDGSLLVFLGQPAYGMTEALRISPFGTILERIRFTGTVVSAASCREGVLMVFENGSAGLCSVGIRKSAGAATRWAYNSAVIPGTVPRIIPAGNDTAVIIRSSGHAASAVVLKTADGTRNAEFPVPGIASDAILFATASSSDIICADTHTAVCCSLEQDASGSVLWTAQLPDRTSGTLAWNYLYYTPDDTIILCGNSWALSGFRMMQLFRHGIFFTEKHGYPDYYGDAVQEPDIGPSFLFSADSRSAGRLKQGMYGEEELSWVRQIRSSVSAYHNWYTQKVTNIREEPPGYATDKTALAPFFGQLCLFGTDVFPPMIADLLSVEQDPSLLAVLADTASVCAFDPDGGMLAALGTVLARAQPADHNLLDSICDAVYGICRFMGRPAFYRQGNYLLSRLLTRPFDNTTAAYARSVLDKLAALNM